MSTFPSRRSVLCGAAALALALRARGQEPRPTAPSGPGPAAPLRLKKAVKYDMIAPSTGSVAERFALLKSLGFDGVELNSPSDIDRDAVVEACRETGIVVHGVIDSVHWHTRFSDPDVAVRQRALEALLVAIDDAHRFGADTVLIVPGRVDEAAGEGREAVKKRSQETITKALPRAREKQVTIAVEVVWNDFLRTPEELVAYVDDFADPRVGAYFDCSNVVKLGVPGATWIEALGPRLAKLDFKGYSREKGWVPIGEGDEDWPAIRAALSKIGYTGWATAEVGAGGREHLFDVKKRMDLVLGA